MIRKNEEIDSKGCNDITTLIFVHGIVGNNRIFDFLQPEVPQQYEVRYVELKGHGGDALSFSQASMVEWKKQVEDVVEELISKDRRIVGVGHSMGCLLLMEQAGKGRLDGLFLLNPPLRIRPRFTMLSNAFKVAIGHTENNPILQAAAEAYGISLDVNPFHYYGWPLRYTELFVEIVRVRRKILPYIQCPLRAFLSVKDEMVSLSAKRDFDMLPNASVTLLPTSTHYYYSPGDKVVIISGFMEFAVSDG